MFINLLFFVAAGSAAASNSRNLWVSGLSSTTRATDLKTLFSKYGKVSLYRLSCTVVKRQRIYRSLVFAPKCWTLFIYFIFPGLLYLFVPASPLSVHFLQVVGAKVVTNAKSPGARCYGFVTMSSTEEATKSISHLNRTELHGRMISVERVSVAVIPPT